MTFLSPWSALATAAVAIPLLVLLYFLKLRRQQLRIASTLLWQKSFEDLQVNAPFQRLRWSLLLVLQLLLLLLLLLALSDPMIRGQAATASRIVLLIDRSASMNALIAPVSRAPAISQGRTRLDNAKDTARKMIAQLGQSEQAHQMMLIAFGSSAQVVSTFESDPRTLNEAIDSIEPTDEQANFDAALQLAGAFAGTSEEPREQTPDVVLLSDGGVGSAGDSSGYSLRAGNFRFVQVVAQADTSIGGVSTAVNNIGIASFSARRNYDDPARVLVFARLVNAGSQAVETVATLLVDGQPAASIRKTIPPANDKGPGEESFTQALDLPGGSVLTLRQGHRDDLADDDVAALVLPAPARPRIALVHPDDSKADQFLHDLLEATEPRKLDVISTQAYANLDAKQIDSGALYDLIVFDRVSTKRLPGVPSLTMGGVPAPLLEVRHEPSASNPAAATAPERSTGHHILSWDRQHPLMRDVSLDTIVYAGFTAFALPAAAAPLAFGPDGPIMAVLRTRSARHVAVGFELVKSNWPVHVSCAVFLQNVMDYLTLAESGQSGMVSRPGEPLTVRAASDAHELVIDGPVRASISAEPGASVTLPILRRAGLYTVKGAAPPYDQIAVSVLSDVESDIRPRDQIMVNAKDAAAKRAAGTASMPLWPWLIGAGFVLLVLEWLVYCRRVRGY